MLLALLRRLGLAGYVVECDSMPRKESREKERGGGCGRDDGSPAEGFRRSLVSRVAQDAKWTQTQLDNGVRERWSELGWSADVEHPTSQGQGPEWTWESSGARRVVQVGRLLLDNGTA